MKDKKQTQKPNKAFRRYAIYSGIAFQMIVIIGLGTYVGTLLDAHFETQKPLLTAGISLLSVLIAIFVAIRQFLSNSKKHTE